MPNERKSEMSKPESKIGVTVIGATGYSGAELVRILLQHPRVKLEKVISRTFVGKPISQIHPWLRTNLICQELNIGEITSSIVFTALPHATSMGIVGKLYGKSRKIVDLSADFRLQDTRIYEKWYGLVHQQPNLLRKAVYGLPELNRDKIRKSCLVANPGCYPTAAILALAPALQKNLIEKQAIIVDAKSGVTGAGRKLTLTTHFPEVNENMNAYQVEGHRHLPEMEEELSKLSGGKVQITFVPHLIPLNRGILSTCYARLCNSLNVREIQDLYTQFYQQDPFVEVLPVGNFPQIKEVIFSNRCRLGLTINNTTGWLIVISVIDNLGKGASGQAVQNMNLMCGFPEELGLC